MKKLLLASVALVGLAGGALAADLPMRRAAPVFTPVPVFTWTGFYVGAHAGYMTSDSAARLDDSNFGFGFEERERIGLSDEGAMGGVQAGYNWQTGMVVWGFEADI